MIWSYNYLAFIPRHDCSASYRNSVSKMRIAGNVLYISSQKTFWRFKTQKFNLVLVLMSIKRSLTLFWQCSCLDLIFRRRHFRKLSVISQNHVLVKISSTKISYGICNIYNRYLRNDGQSMFRERVGVTILATFLINIFFLLFYVNIQPSIHFFSLQAPIYGPLTFHCLVFCCQLNKDNLWEERG